MGNLRQQVASPWVNVAVTGVSTQAILPAISGYQYVITQLGHHENRGDIRNIYVLFGNDEHFKFTTGASGSIIWDMVYSQELPPGSGLNGHLDFPGSVDYLVKYVVRDVREPSNLNPRTFVNRPVRTPNCRGQQ